MGFEDNIDTFRLDDNLWGGGKTVAQVLADHATPGVNLVDLNFGGRHTAGQSSGHYNRRASG